MLTGPIFMLQVYDRVLPSRSEATLGTLFTLVAGLYVIYAFAEAVRSRTTARIARNLDDRLTSDAFASVVRAAQRGTGDPVWAVRENDTLRSFVGSGGPLALLDLPWTPIYLGLVYLLHPALGWLAGASLLIVIGLMIVTDLVSRGPVADSATTRSRRDQMLRDVTVNADAVAAMNMRLDLEPVWRRRNGAYTLAQQKAGDRSSLLSAITKSVRLLVQSAVLAVGAALVLDGELSAGVMIAASIITSRALAPVEQLVAHWRGLVASRSAFSQLAGGLVDATATARTRMPMPVKGMAVSDLVVVSPSGRVLVDGARFELRAGEAVGVIGPSGVGKTSLVRVLSGSVAASHGEIRLDGVRLDHFGDDRGFIVGYLPQNLDLFNGTVAENIARFQATATDSEIVAAAIQAGAHEMILALTEGYDTQVGERGQFLSAGQRQRVGLARALFGSPFLVILDEPNSNLDADGDIALASAIRGLRDRGAVTIVVAHRPSALAEVSKVLHIARDGNVIFGNKADVLGRTTLPVSAGGR